MKARPEHIESYYAATVKGARQRPALRGDVSCDVCVIGGGLTGLSSALHLAERGYDVVLLEAEKIGWGASGRNGGQLGSGQRKDQVELEKQYGKEVAHRLWDFAEEAKALSKDLIRRYDIPCDFRPGILYAAVKPAHAEWERRYIDKLRADYGCEDRIYVSREEVAAMVATTVYHGGGFDRSAGHLHPLNFVLGVARAAEAAGARLFEGSRVAGYDRAVPTCVRTEQGAVKASYVVLACNGYLDRLEPRVAGKIMPINNYVLATEPLSEERRRAVIRDDIAVADSKFVVDYYRFSPDRRLLFGGGETYTRRFPSDIKSFVRKYMLRVFPQLADVGIDYAWGGTLAITMNRMPHFGRLAPNVFFAHGYSGHGLAYTVFAGKVIAEALAGTAERFDVMAGLKIPTFPGGTLLRWPGLVLGMLYYSLRDKL